MTAGESVIVLGGRSAAVADPRALLPALQQLGRAAECERSPPGPRAVAVRCRERANAEVAALELVGELGRADAYRRRHGNHRDPLAPCGRDWPPWRSSSQRLAAWKSR